ncbi:hypothetical protein lerEdw1_003221 [Lerista edwardsae]|nr:hypothetical protein lerEdw1_003221 [Lerista edwardsae]
MHSLNDQISDFIVTKAAMLNEDESSFLPSEKDTLKTSMSLMRHLLMDAQGTGVVQQRRVSAQRDAGEEAAGKEEISQFLVPVNPEEDLQQPAEDPLRFEPLRPTSLEPGIAP